MSAGCSLYSHFDAAGKLLYIGISLNPLNRLRQHNQTAEWHDKIARVEIEQFPTRCAALEAERKAILRENPSCNVKRVRGEPAKRGRKRKVKPIAQRPSHIDYVLPGSVKQKLQKC